MKYKVAIRKIWICFLLSCIFGSLAGCSSLVPSPENEIQSKDFSEEETLVTEEYDETKHTDEEVQENEQPTQSEYSVELKNVSDIYYAYHTLDESGRKIYMEILPALAERKKDVTVSTVDPNALKYVFTCVMNDHPELFYVDGYQFTKYSVGDTITRISFYGTYSMTEDEIDENQTLIDNYVNQCLAGMPTTEDEYTKAKYLYDYIIEQTEYDKEAPNNQNICSVFINYRSVCQGYAKALQYLMQKAGIVSTLVTGFTQQEGHAWNLVRVNGAYYYVDATWGDASYSFAEGSDTYSGSIPPINYDYFLVTTKDLCVTHQPDCAFQLPECIEQKDNYYIREGLYFSEYSEDKLKLIFEQAYAGTSGYVMFKCSDEQVFDMMKQKLIVDQEVFRFIKNQGESIAYTDNRQQRTISFWI